MEKKTSRRIRLPESNTLTLIIVLIAVIAIFSLLKPTYLTAVNAINIVYACCVTGILSIGVTLLLIAGKVDLSCGAIGAASGVLLAVLVTRMNIPWYAALLICLVFGAANGAINAILTNVFGLQPFIATLAMASVCQGMGYLFCGGRSVSLINNALSTLGAGRILGNIPIPILFLVALYIVFSFILSRTTFGRTIYVIGGNPIASRLAGLNPKKISAILYIISGVLASLAGCLLAGRMRSGAPNAVSGAEFDAIIAAVLGGVAFTGGRGNFGGCLLGMLIIQCFSNGLNFLGMSSFWQQVAKGLLLIGSLLVDFVRSRKEA